MRWDKLFADLEAAAADDELAERDALVSDLREGELAATTWLRLAGGQVTLEVSGLGRVEGVIMAANDRLLHLQTTQSHVVVGAGSVLAVVAATARSGPRSAVADRLGWTSVLRMLQRDRDRVQICRIDGSVRSGLVDLVGADFVRVRDEAGQAPIIPLAAIAAVSCPR